MTTTKLHDGVIVNEVVHVELQGEDVGAQVAKLRALAVFQGVPERIEAHAAKMRKALEAGADGSRKDAAEGAITYLGWALERFQKINDEPSRKLATDAMLDLMRGMEMVWRADVKSVEPEITTGAKARRGSAAGNELLRANAKAERDRLQSRANEIWARRPALTKTDVARLIDPNQIEYIRKRIIKPTQ